MSKRLQDRVCVVTGATGMAAAAARSISAEGGKVFVISRRAEGAAALAAEVEAIGGAAGSHSADLRDDAAAGAAFGPLLGALIAFRLPLRKLEGEPTKSDHAAVAETVRNSTLPGVQLELEDLAAATPQDG